MLSDKGPKRAYPVGCLPAASLPCVTVKIRKLHATLSSVDASVSLPNPNPTALLDRSIYTLFSFPLRRLCLTLPRIAARPASPLLLGQSILSLLYRTS